VAIQSIYRDLEYATNLIKAKAGKNQPRKASEADGGATATSGGAAEVHAAGAGVDLDDDEEEESWTFVGGDAETIDDDGDGGLMKTVADLRDLNLAANKSFEGLESSKVMGGAAGSGAAVS